jgi:hypothetical protein
MAAVDATIAMAGCITGRVGTGQARADAALAARTALLNTDQEQHVASNTRQYRAAVGSAMVCDDQRHRLPVISAAGVGQDQSPTPADAALLLGWL